MSTGPMEAVWLPVLPSFKGFGPALAKGAAADADKAGRGIGLSLGKSIVAGVALAGAGLAATGTALYKIGSVFNDVSTTISVATGATGEDLGRLTDAAKRISTTVPRSFEDISTAVASVQSSISGFSNLTEAEFDQATTNALNFSKAFEIDTDRVTQVVGQMMKTGLVADANEAFDLLTAASQKVPAALREDLLDAVDEYGPFFSQLGISGEEAMNALASASDKGVFGIDKTGDALKEFTIRATDMSKASGDAYDALGLSQEEMSAALLAGGDVGSEAFQKIIGGLQGIQDPVAQSQAALALFGTPLEDLGTANIPQFIDALSGAESVLGDVEGAAGRMGDSLNSGPGAAFDLLKNRLMVGLAPVAEWVFNTLGDLLTEVTGSITAFGAAWKYNDGDITSSGMPGMFEHLGYWARQAFDYFQTNVMPRLREFGTYLAVNVLPVVQRFGAFLTGTLVPALMQAVRWVSDNAVMLQRIATVIGVIMIPALVRWGIASAVNGAKAAAAWVVAQTAAIRAGVVYAAQSALMVAKWVWMGAQSLLQAARMAAAWLIAMGPVGWVIAAVVGLAAIVIANWDKIRNFTVAAWTAVTSWINTTWTNIKNTVSAALAWVGAWINTKMAQIQLGWALVWGAIKNFFVGIWNGIKQTIADAIAWVANWINVKATQIRVGWEIVWARIKNTIVTVWDGIKTTISNAWTGIKSTIQTLIDFVRNNVSQAFEKAKDGIATAWNKIQEVAKKPVRFVVERVINDGLIGTFNKIPGVNISKVSLPKGFAHGGYTGDGGKYDPAGIVHKGEYVFTKEQTAAFGKERLASMAHSAVRGAASNMSPMAGQPAFFGGNVSQIARHRALYMDVASGMGPWDFPGAARMWNGAAGVKVAVGRGSHQGYARPLERGGGILGYATGTNIDMSPSWMSQLSAANRRKTAAHELGHALGLPHFTGVNSIMNPYLGAQAGQPTSYDIRALQRLYPGGTGKAGSGEATNPFNGVIDMMMAKLKEAFPGGGMFIDAAGGLAKTGIGQVMKIVEDIKNGLKNLADNVFGKVKDFFGGGASSAEAPLFRDQGGILPPGLSTVLNATGGNEYVLNRRQWNDLHALATRTASQEPMGGMEVNFNGPVLGDPADIIREFKTETQRASTLNSLRRVSVG